MEKKNKSMTLNCNGKIIDFSTKKIMGIVNISEDSFYDGGKFNTIEKVNSHVSNLISNGADIIDLGAASSKPGSNLIKPDDEYNLVSNYINELTSNFKNVLFSIDTYNSLVADFALSKGFSLVNDISSGRYDKEMFKVLKKYNAGYIMMHMQGDPLNMQENPSYQNIIESLISFFKLKIKELEGLGFSNIIIDPGFGFGKNIEDNYEILKKLNLFQTLEKPIMVGLSRKSMIYKVLNVSPQEALNGTTVLNTLALERGANIIRVHDVKEAMECKKILARLH
ncbi:dihydropteroate synthase [Flavobacteriaceae bacterium]|nr:dihydropteroate synthase [Flavobacteriaceae bacterium]MDC0560260.1 dihydropteroate synthase [Flavobacteriaceae bacterium]MDC0879576.1 dihydropteroate synthase [Flavobacteriaceae bacterium]